VYPAPVLALMSALCASSSRAINLCPYKAARCNAVCPALFFTSTSALYSSSSQATDSCLCRTASCSAVCPPSLLALTSAPRPRRNFTTFLCPAVDATCIPIIPPRPREFTEQNCIDILIANKEPLLHARHKVSALKGDEIPD